MRRNLIPAIVMCCAVSVAVLALAALPARAMAADEPYGVGAAGPEARYVDATGAKLRYGMQAQRIVSLAPNVTEMLYFIGLGPRLVGRSDYCDWPPEALKLPSVGGFVDTSLESVIALKPDLVVAYQGNSRELVEQLRQLGITVLALGEAATLDEIGEQMLALRNVADVAAGDYPPELVDWYDRLGKLEAQAAAGKTKLTLFFGYPGEMSFSAGPASFVGDLILKAGASNIVSKSSERWPSVSAEFIVGAKPQWLLTATDCTGKQTVAQRCTELLKQLAADKVWATLPAVKSAQLVVIDSDLLLRPGPRILDALAQLVDALHPQPSGKAGT